MAFASARDITSTTFSDYNVILRDHWTWRYAYGRQRIRICMVSKFVCCRVILVLVPRVP